MLSISFFTVVVTFDSDLESIREEKEPDNQEKQPYIDNYQNPNIPNIDKTLGEAPKETGLELNNFEQNLGTKYLGETLAVELQEPSTYLENGRAQSVPSGYSLDLFDVAYSYDDQDTSYAISLTVPDDYTPPPFNVVYLTYHDISTFRPGTIHYRYRVDYDSDGALAQTGITQSGTYYISQDDIDYLNFLKKTVVEYRISPSGTSSIRIGFDTVDSVSFPEFSFDVKYVYFRTFLFYFVPEPVDFNLRTEYEYISDSQIIHTLNVEVYLQDSTIRIFHNSKWDYFGINVDSDVTENTNNIHVIDLIPITYVVKFSYFVDNYANAVEVTSQFFDDPSFEQGNSVFVFGEGVSQTRQNNQYVFDGSSAYSFRITGSQTVNIPLESELLDGDYVFSIAYWNIGESTSSGYLSLQYYHTNFGWIEFWNDENIGNSGKGVYNNIQARFRVDNTSVSQLRLQTNPFTGTNTFVFDNLKLYQTKLDLYINEFEAPVYTSQIINIDGYQTPIVEDVINQVYVVDLETGISTFYGNYISDNNGNIEIIINQELIAYNEYRLSLYTINGNFDNLLRDSLSCSAYAGNDGSCSTASGNIVIQKNTGNPITYDSNTNYAILGGSLLYLDFSYTTFGTFRVEVLGITAQGGTEEQIEVYKGTTNTNVRKTILIDLSHFILIDEIILIPQKASAYITLYSFRILTHDLFYFTPVEAGVSNLDEVHIYNFDLGTEGWEVDDRNLYSIDNEVDEGLYKIGGLSQAGAGKSNHNSWFFVSPVIPNIQDHDELHIRLKAEKQYRIFIGNTGDNQFQTITTEYQTIVFELHTVDFNNPGYENRILLAFDSINTIASNGFNANTLIEIDTIVIGEHEFYNSELSDLGDTFILTSDNDQLRYYVVSDGIGTYVNDLEDFERNNSIGTHYIIWYIVNDMSIIDNDIIQLPYYVDTYFYTNVVPPVKNFFQLYYIDSDGLLINDFQLITRYNGTTIDSNKLLSLYGSLNVNLFTFQNYYNNNTEYGLIGYSAENSTEENLYTVFLQFNIKGYNIINSGDYPIMLSVDKETTVNNVTLYDNQYDKSIDPGDSSMIYIDNDQMFRITGVEMYNNGTHDITKTTKIIDGFTTNMELDTQGFSSERINDAVLLREDDTEIGRSTTQTIGNFFFTTGVLGLVLYAVLQLFGGDMNKWFKQNILRIQPKEYVMYKGKLVRADVVEKKNQKKNDDLSKVAFYTLLSILGLGFVLRYLV